MLVTEMKEKRWNGQNLLHIGVVGNLGQLSPNDLSTCRHESQFRDVDLDDGALRQDSELGVHRALRVLLDGDDRQLNRNSQFRVYRMSCVSTGYSTDRLWRKSTYGSHWPSCIGDP